MYLEQVKNVIAANNKSRNILSTFCKGEQMITTEAGHKADSAHKEDLKQLLEILLTRQNIILNEQQKTHHEVVALLYVDPTWSPFILSGIHILEAYKSGHLTKEEMNARQNLSDRLSLTESKLKEALDDISEAIDFLRAYLDSSSKGIASKNNWNTVAQTSPAKKDYLEMFDGIVYKNLQSVYDSVVDRLDAGECDVQTVIDEIKTGGSLSPEQLYDVFQFSSIENLPNDFLTWLDHITQNDNSEFRSARYSMAENLEELV